MKKDLVIVRVDGGVVSQLYFVALGKMFEKQGFEVKYDISWYEKDSHHFYSKDKGYDKDYTLSWDIPKIFPKLEFQIASKEEIKRHKKKYKLDDEAALTYKRPMYIDQYNLMGSCDIAPICEELKKDFSVAELGKDEKFTNLAHEIESTQSCGVHVRRGDLSKDHIVYGRASDVSYFVKSINLARKINKELKKLYLFSDDKAWVRQNLCPHLKDIEYILCDVSTPENGYLDLYLLSKCKIIIGSQGGMGGGAKLMAKDETLLISPKLFLNYRSFNNLIIVNWDKSEDFAKKIKQNLNIKLKYRIMLKVYHRLRQKLLSKFYI